MYLFYFDLANTYYFYVNDFQKAILNYRKVIENSNPWLKRAHINSLVLSGYCYLELGDTLYGNFLVLKMALKLLKPDF